MIEIKGIIESIIFRNAENCYSVVELNSDENLVTCTGLFPIIAEGDNVILTGEFKDTKYGRQFATEKVKMFVPTSEEGIFRYLSSGLFKGVGEVTAKNIVNRFKERTFDVIENNPKELALIKGVTASKAAQIANAYREIKTMQNSMLFLQEKGLTIGLAIKIFKVYKNNTIDIVSNNPYKLVEDIEGVGFKTADKIADLIGISKSSSFRARAGIVYYLKVVLADIGSTTIKKSDLITDCANLLELDEEDNKLLSVIAELSLEGVIKNYFIDGDEFVAFSVNYYTERMIATKLKELNVGSSNEFFDISADIDEFEKQFSIKLHSEQAKAVKSVFNQGVSIITGGPGTGKTTIIKCILHIFKKHNKEVGLVAPTGRAAKRLSESTGEEAKTIHRMLDLDYKNGKGSFAFNESTRLPQDVLVVDEVSMTDIFVMKSLVSAVKNGGRIILVGDKDQLPSVGAGNVLSDILKSQTFSSVYLTEIFRQGKESLIITNAHRINNGEMPILNVTDNDFFHSNINEQDKILQRILQMVFETLPKFLNIQAKDIQVLAPMKKGVCGTINLNKCLQNKLNPKRSGANELIYGDNIFRVGDRVMNTTNNYQIEWTKGDDIVEMGVGIFNGDIGEVVEIHKGDNTVTVQFEDGKLVTFESENIGDLMLSYAISIHKSQGSEFDAVIVPVTGGAPRLFSRNLLYTAITRAKRAVVTIGSCSLLAKMVENNYIEERQTMLKDFLLSQLN